MEGAKVGIFAKFSIETGQIYHISQFDSSYLIKHQRDQFHFHINHLQKKKKMQNLNSITVKFKTTFIHLVRCFDIGPLYYT